MSRRLPPLNAVKAFEAAARHLSFTRAAEELFVTQAAVSHQIKALEEHLGLKLFRRRNRSLLLTEEGQGYFLDIKDLFTQLADATERLLARSATGSLTVSMTPSFAIQSLVPKLARFSELHPEVDVRIKAVDQDEGSLTEDVDVAIYFGRGNWPGLRADKLRSECLVPVCSPRLLNGAKPLRSIEDLSKHTLLHDMSRHNWKAWAKQHEQVLPSVNTGPIFSHSSLVLQAAIHGQGIALGSSVLARPEVEAGRLVCPFDKVLLNKNAYYLVCHQSQEDLGKIQAFRDWLIQSFAEEAHSDLIPGVE
ncbi:transcriptional regulator GcvA [Ferrimonas marina]|uniref:LysR family transcriptional regulator, glycine cleavage system transcriptional activator n=1 Tax=Ferrimonas marina TaxID=299255 RepID=A0A1M5SC31_9GAMM|nr:transcriptional regulator GcvA [Ferrimonas marina]SHH36025.1 LysR family transcriptional regulator, glycine cleavage system transcriptional activator [Ferrimonas marina]